jgi:deoxyribodipyrimidine photo-lyase
MTNVSIFWHRRDLRLQDNAGMFAALQGDYPVLPIFIFDTHILDKLEDKADARVQFIHQQLTGISTELAGINSSIKVLFGDPLEQWQQLLETYQVKAVYTNHDYEPYAMERDAAVQALLTSRNIPFYTYKDHVIFEKKEITKDDGKPYTVFSPYARKWKAALSKTPITPYPSHDHVDKLLKCKPFIIPTLESMGFSPTVMEFPPPFTTQSIIANYDKNRNFPAINGTSRLGIHFRFGTISIREKALKALQLNETFLNELIWRDFYAMILANFPHVATHPFRKEYENIAWRNDEADFQRWCTGTTGYPIVDAGMRELATTGYMHNRVRMITASFLTKHLLIDWRLGEAWFAKKLLDFDMASNSGGWQWAAGCGTDAAPYFRVFNPTTQQEKFDADLKYVRKWIPEYGTSAYPKPMVDHKFARERCLEAYKAGLAR